MAIRLSRPTFGPNPRTRLVHYDRDLARYDVPTTPAIDDARADVDRIEALAEPGSGLSAKRCFWPDTPTQLAGKVMR